MKLFLFYWSFQQKVVYFYCFNWQASKFWEGKVWKPSISLIRLWVWYHSYWPTACKYSVQIFLSSSFCFWDTVMSCWVFRCFCRIAKSDC